MKRILLMLTFCLAIECLSTDQALAQRTPPTARTIEVFHRIKPQMSMKQVIDICGVPDEDIGSGIHIYVYNLSDGSLVRIGTPDKKRLIYVAHVSPNGEARSIIQIPKRKHKSKRRLPYRAAQQIVGRESRCIGMFRIMIDPAMLDWIRAAASTQTLCGTKAVVFRNPVSACGVTSY